MQYDTTRSGYLTFEELTEALKTGGFNLAKDEI